MATITLQIVGAIEEMQCGGTGCSGCPYAIRDSAELACQLDLQNGPVGLAKSAERAGATLASLPEMESLGAQLDGGHIFDLDELTRMLAGLKEAQAALADRTDDEGNTTRGSGEANFFNERQDLALVADAFDRASAHKKRVRLEV